MMDVAVPENLRVRAPARGAAPACRCSRGQLLATWPEVDGQLIDIREES
ncbi:MAG: hypothetical protein R3D28_16275 [Geminicoccaceae bacterium]